MSKDLENKSVFPHDYKTSAGITLKEFYLAVAVHGILSNPEWTSDLDLIVANANMISNRMIKKLSEQS